MVQWLRKPTTKGAPMAIGDVLVRIRKERNLTQEDLARKLYVTRQAVSRWENGETTPGIDMCKLIAATCDVPVALPFGDARRRLLPKLRHAVLPGEGSWHRGGRLSVGRLLLVVLCERRVSGRRDARGADRALRPIHGRVVPHHARRSRFVMGALLPTLKRW